MARRHSSNEDTGLYLSQWGLRTGNHARRADTPLARSIPALDREWGWLVTTTLTGPLGARSRLTVALSVAAPINSDNIGRNQCVAYSKHSVSGVASVFKRLISDHKYFANASASRIVKFLAVAWKTVSRVSVRPRNHSSAAIVINNLANLSWMEVSKMVNFACSHNAGQRTKIVRLEEDIHRWIGVPVE